MGFHTGITFRFSCIVVIKDVSDAACALTFDDAEVKRMKRGRGNMKRYSMFKKLQKANLFYFQ